MESNRDDAARCLGLALAALQAADLPKAQRLLAKSRRMFPLPAEQAQVEARIAAATPSARREVPTPEPARKPTEDMVHVVRAVKVGAREGHYNVLGLTRTATDAEIKKGYRKLALRLHPDKNCAAGADEAFKHVGTAFAVLSDPRRRECYDRFGIDDPSEVGMPASPSDYAGSSDAPSRNARRRKRTAQGGRGRHSGRGRTRTVDDDIEEFMGSMSAEELFEFLFSVSAMAGEEDRAAHATQAREAETVWTKYKPLVILTALLVCACWFIGSGASFSLHEENGYSVRRVTDNGVSYYVPRSFDMPRAGSHAQRQFEAAVDNEAYADTLRKCGVERKDQELLLKRSRYWLSSRANREEYHKLYENHQAPSCEYARRLYAQLNKSRRRQGTQ